MKNTKRTWLRRIRNERGLSQKDIANFIGTTTTFYTYVENGQRRPSPEIAQKIGKILDFDWTRFYSKQNK